MARALREVLRSRVAVRRLVRQFSVGFREALLPAMAPGVAEALRTALELAAITWPAGLKREVAERTAWERAFAAVAEGATIVRVGTALFGSRPRA